MKRSLLLLPGLALLSAVFGARASALQSESQSYLPLSKAETGRRFPVRYAGTLTNRGRADYFEGTKERPLPDHAGIGPSGARVSRTEDEDLVLTGKDQGGRVWRVLLGAMASSYPCRFYVADLDRNRIDDAVLVCPTGGNGLAPSRHLLAITFDRQGRPVPFEADGYFEEDERGIFDLVDMDRDGRAELIHMKYDEGYWVTNLYEAGDARWRRVAGRHARRSYPLYTRFTYRPNRRPTRPRRGRNPFAPDLSNAAPALRGRILSYRWADLSQSEDIQMTVSDGRGRETTCSPVSWYGSFGFVRETEQGRTVVYAYGNEEEAKELLEEARAGRLEVVFYGRRRADKCSPEWAWVNGARP
jgi:hypothetical protein